MSDTCIYRIFGLECVICSCQFQGGWEEVQQGWCEKSRARKGNIDFGLVCPCNLCLFQVPRKVYVPTGKPRGRRPGAQGGRGGRRPGAGRFAKSLSKDPLTVLPLQEKEA